MGRSSGPLVILLGGLGTFAGCSAKDDIAGQGDGTEDVGADGGIDSLDEGGDDDDGDGGWGPCGGGPCCSVLGLDLCDPGDGDGDDDPCGAQIVTFEQGRSPVSEIHVRTDGTDSAGCGVTTNACGSIAFAVGQATPGTAVVIHEGTYPGGGYLGGVQGTQDAPIWIGGAAGEPRPIIDGGDQLFQLSEARYVIVHDLEGQNATQNGINADDGANYDDPDAARFIVFRDLYIHDIGDGGNQDCLKLSGLDDYWVLDSEFARCGGGGSGSAVDHVGCHRGVLARNDFHDLSAGGNAIQNKGGSEDIEIRANVFAGPGLRGINMGGSTGDEFFRPPLSASEPNFEARDIRVIANIFTGWDAPVAFVGCVECLVANNTFDTPDNWVLRILQEKVTDAQHDFLPCGDSAFVNNIVYYDRSELSTHVNVGSNTAAETFEFANNLWYAYDDPSLSDPSAALPVSELDAVVGQDPQLADPGAGDYRIGYGSPAFRVGRPEPALTGDRTFLCYGQPPSIGAHEH